MIRATDDRIVRAINAPAPASQSAEGKLASDAAATILAVDALADGSVLATDGGDGFEFDSGRLLLLAKPPLERLAVAISPSTRRALRRGNALVHSTTAATARLEVRRGTRLVAARSARLRPGATRVAMTTPRSGAFHTIRLTARTPDGAVAEHQLGFISGPALGGATARDALAYYGQVSFGESVATYDRCRHLEPSR